MAIDPMHLPIFGDPRPVEPPAAVRAAAALLVVQVGLTAAVVVRVGADLMLLVLCASLMLWFLHWVKAGRDWARGACCLTGFASVALSFALVGGVVDVFLAGASVVVLAVAAGLMFRADVAPFFEVSEAESA